MLRESNFSSPLAAGRISNESSSRNRLHSTPIRSTQYPKCTHSVAVLARQLREMSPFSSPIKKNEVLDSGLGEPQEASLLSRSSSRCSKVTNACHSIHQQSAYSELYTGSVSSHLNLPSTPSLESTTWSLGVDSSSFSSCLGEPTYIYDCSLRTTYHKGKYLGKVSIYIFLNIIMYLPHRLNFLGNGDLLIFQLHTITFCFITFHTFI